MNIRLKVFCVLLSLHALGLAGAGVQSILFQTGGKSTNWGDLILFSAWFFGLASILAFGAFKSAKGSQTVARLFAVPFGLGGCLEVLGGTAMAIMGFIGPADPYIMPLGVIGAGLGGLHILMGFLGWTGASTAQ